MRTAKEYIESYINKYNDTAHPVYKFKFNKQEMKLFSDMLNEARIEVIKECAEKVKIVRYQPNQFVETALGNTQRDWIDKQSILHLIDELK